MRRTKAAAQHRGTPVEGQVLQTLDDADDNDGLVRRSFGITVRAVDKGARTVDVVASTAALDSYEEVVVQNWDLKRFKSNPVVLWNHNRSSFFGGSPDDYLPIGHATGVKVSDGSLLATLNFVDASANPLAEKIWQGFLQGSIRAVSVGFEPHTITSEKEDDRVYYKLDDNELYEISVCPMGANPEAVAKSRDKAAKQIKHKMAALQTGGELIGVDPHTLPVATTKSSTTASPAEPQKDTTMTVEEQKALEAKNAELQAKNAELQAKLGTASEKTAQLETESKATQAKLDACDKALETEKAKTATLNERCTTLETERAAQQKRADELSQKATEKELDELVGTKIAPTEKAGLVKLSLLDAALYQEQLAAIKSRPDMKMLGAVIGTDPSPAPATAKEVADDGGDDLLKSVNKRLEAPAAQN